MKTIKPADLQARLKSDAELALIDVRELGVYSQCHLLWAVCIPLGRLELELPRLVPRRSVPVVLCDAGEGLAGLAAQRMSTFGYTDVTVLDGGLDGWREAGFELFSGVNVPSKAFGEYVEHEFDTPNISAEELKAWLDGGEDVVVLDSRPMPEYHTMSVPGGVCVPGAELAYRVHDLVKNPDTTVVVNCAGRTRSIIGAQSLINAGVPNKVMALRNGTMAWHLAGYQLARGATERPQDISPEAVAKAQAAAEQVAQRFGVRYIARAELDRMRGERDIHTLFILDVRSPEEYAEAHLPDALHAPGGQLVQATDEYVGVLGARIVLVDDTGVRATMTASWLNQLGWKHVYVLEDGLTGAQLVSGRPQRELLGRELLEVDLLNADALQQRIGKPGVQIVDVNDSKTFRRGHIQGAVHAVRSRLTMRLAELPEATLRVFTSSDGLLAMLAANDCGALLPGKVAVLEGGNEAWQAAGHELLAGDEGVEENPGDVWVSPYDNAATLEQSMQAYLDWEIALVAQIERDGTTRFGAQ